jgi:PIN domain nuclease of toxin-antitoxin system
MNLLLDTHTFIWFSEGNKALPNKAKELIEDINNTSFISMVSLWEMSIKISLNKLQIKIPFENLYNVIVENGFVVLPISFNHLVAQNKLEFHHRDPFDRL